MNGWTVTLGLVGCLLGGAVAKADITTFEDGANGWEVNGLSGISWDGGNPGYCMDVFVEDSYSFEISNFSNPALIGDYTQSGGFHLTIDVNVETLGYFGSPGSRGLTVQLVDFVSMDPPEACAVWAEIGTLSQSNPGWYTYSIDVLDPTATELPDGWNGLQLDGTVGLPEGRTFASVLASVDGIGFTTSVPGDVPSLMNYELVIDNIGVTAIPEPTTMSLLGLGALALLRRRR